MDTLEITKKLEGAGFERPKAEALATVVSAGAGARDEQLDDLRSRLGRVEAAVEALGHRLDARIDGLDHKLEAQIAKARNETIIWTVGALGVLFALMRLLP